MFSAILYRFVIAVSCSLPIACSIAAADDEATISFAEDIQPILTQHCVQCHGPTETESGLRVDNRPALLRGGDSGEPALVPKKASDSLLIRLIQGDDPDRRMPPNGDPLSSEEVSRFVRWIDQGADWPGQMHSDNTKHGTTSTSESDHWSLQPIQRPAVPVISGCVNPIDAFIARKLNTKKLQFAAPADPVVLKRRVSLVLTGLPPDSIDLGDAATEQYGQMVDRLLASPRYGEHWAQHWLDVIRWAETVGFETNQERKNAWPYRDWVIDALNRDTPYDQFIKQQILGDALTQDAALGFLVAGPANLPGQIGRDEDAMRQARQDELDEVIQTVSQSVMGLTIGCARCHNHKFDPILQRDYYSMQAIFAGLSYGDRRLRGDENDRLTAEIPATTMKLEQLATKAESLRRRHQLRLPLPAFPSETFDAILADGVRMEIAATNNDRPAALYELQAWSTGQSSTTKLDEGEVRNVALASNGGRASASSFALANQTRHFDNLIDGSVDRRQAFPWTSAKSGPAWVQVDFDEPTPIDRIAWDTSSNVPVDLVVQVHDVATDRWVAVATSRDRMLRTDDVRKAESITVAELSLEEVKEFLAINGQLRQTRASLNRISAGPRVYAASFTKDPAPTWQLRRGDPMQRISEVAPSTPVVLGTLSLDVGASDSARREALANKLTSRKNPLSARVIVNRIWQHHFGVGLVDTPSDFGKMGSVPSHPHLLDWLASELVEHDWSVKYIHRLILHSRTFKQSSALNKMALKTDADSRLLWRFPPRRIEAEAIRDSILQASGKLNLEMGGRGFDFFRQRGGLADYKPIETFDSSGWRRMIYAHKIRMQSVDVFGTFDCPDAGQMKPRRTQSITPLQSLSLLNSPFVNRQASFFAERIRREVGENSSDQLDRAFEIAYSRKATHAERENLLEFLNAEGLEQLCRVVMNTSEFLYLR